MSLERINPAGLAAPETYTHAIVATGTRLVFVAGQVSEDGDGQLVGDGDLAAQARQAFTNVGTAASSRSRPSRSSEAFRRRALHVVPGTGRGRPLRAAVSL